MLLYSSEFTVEEILYAIEAIRNLFSNESIIINGNGLQLDLTDKKIIMESDIDKACNLGRNTLYKIPVMFVPINDTTKDELNPYEFGSYDSILEGIQTKCLNDYGDFVKLDSGKKEGLNECIAYRIFESVFEVDSVKYTSCLVNTGIDIRTGCISKHIDSYGLSNVKRLSDIVDLDAKSFHNLPRDKKIMVLSEHININNLFKLLTIDILICNTDRHLGNILVCDGDICDLQYDHGLSFASGIDCNIYTDSFEDIIKDCIFKPFDFTLNSFISKYKEMKVEPIHISKAKLEKALCFRSMLYSPNLIKRRLELLKYTLNMTKGILWVEV